MYCMDLKCSVTQPRFHQFWHFSFSLLHCYIAFDFSHSLLHCCIAFDFSHSLLLHCIWDAYKCSSATPNILDSDLWRKFIIKRYKNVLFAKFHQNSFAFALVVAFLKVLPHNQCDRCGHLQKKSWPNSFSLMWNFDGWSDERTNKVKTVRKVLTLDEVSKRTLELLEKWFKNERFWRWF